MRRQRLTIREVMHLNDTIRYLQAGADALDASPIQRDRAIVLLSSAGLTTRAISTILTDYGITLSWGHVAAIIRTSAPELPL